RSNSGGGGKDRAGAIGAPRRCHSSAEILHLGSDLLKTLPLANQQVPVVASDSVHAGRTGGSHPDRRIGGLYRLGQEGHVIETPKLPPMVKRVGRRSSSGHRLH